MKRKKSNEFERMRINRKTVYCEKYCIRSRVMYRSGRLRAGFSAVHTYKRKSNSDVPFIRIVFSLPASSTLEQMNYLTFPRPSFLFIQYCQTLFKGAIAFSVAVLGGSYNFRASRAGDAGGLTAAAAATLAGWLRKGSPVTYFASRNNYPLVQL